MTRCRCTSGTAAGTSPPDLGVPPAGSSDSSSATSTRTDGDLVDFDRFPFVTGPAPAELLHFASGIPVPLRITVQGLILDPGSSHGRVAVTNGVVIDAE